MERVLVIGYGNTLRGDDGLGPRAAEELESRWAGRGLAHLFCLQLTPELAMDLAEVDAVLFLDASCDLSPGEVDCREVTPPLADGTARSFTHHMKPDTLLGLCRDLFGHSPRAWLVTAGAADFDGGEKLTPTAEAALPRMVARAEEILRTLLPAQE